MSSLPGLDESNVVDIDLGSAEFKANAHRHMAEWARRRAVLCAEPRPAAGGGRPLRRRAPGLRRYGDVRLGDAARPGLGAVQQDHGCTIRDPDGRRAACPRSPPVDAGVLVATDRATAGEHRRDRRRHAGPYRGQRARVRRHDGLRCASRRRCFAGCDGKHGREAQGDLRRIPRSDSGHHLRQAGRAVVCRSCGAPSTAPWTRSR